MITKDMTIGNIINIKKDAQEIFMEYGMGCVGCPSAQNETLEDAASIHGLNLDDLLDRLNS